MARLLIIAVLLIVYGSLYPWHFQASIRPEAQLFDFPSLTHIFTAYMLSDLVLNIALYMPIGLLAFFALAGKVPQPVLFAAALGFTVSFAVEGAQAFTLTRDSNALDVLANTLGAAAGAIAALWFRHHRLSPAGVRFVHHADGLILILSWVAYQLLPFVPSYHRHTGFIFNFRWYRPGAAGYVDAILVFAEILALARLVEWVAEAPLNRSRRSRLVFGALLLLVPVKAFCLRRELTALELAAVLVAALLALSTRILAFAGPLMIAAVVARGLAPFDFRATPTPFQWVPFLGSFTAEREIAYVLCAKAFRYVSMVELTAVRSPWILRLAAAALILAAVEFLQMRLPGHSPEITDVVVLVVIAITVRAVHAASARLQPPG